MPFALYNEIYNLYCNKQLQTRIVKNIVKIISKIFIMSFSTYIVIKSHKQELSKHSQDFKKNTKQGLSNSDPNKVCNRKLVFVCSYLVTQI